MTFVCYSLYRPVKIMLYYKLVSIVPGVSKMKKTKRRQFLAMLGLGSTSLVVKQAQAHHTDTHFEDKSTHRLVYQLNKADHDYIESILFSCGEMLRKYGDDIELVIAAFGPGIHLIATHPKRAISSVHQQRVQSLM